MSESRGLLPEIRGGLAARGKEFSKRLRENSVLATNYVRYRDRKGLKTFTTLKDLQKLKDMFTTMDPEYTGSVDMDVIEKFICTEYDSESAALALMANFSKEGGKAQLKKIERLFRRGVPMTFVEFVQLAYPQAPHESVLEMVEAITDNSEKYAKAVAEEQRRKLRVAEEEEKQLAWIATVWPLWDADGSGELDEHEFKAVVRDIGGSVNDADEFFEEIDTDASGTVSKEEFINWWQGRGEYNPSFITDERHSVATLSRGA
eukprot:gene6827-8157_t